MRTEYVLPASVLLGCGLIAIGLYFGLRSQKSADAPTGNVVPTSASVSPQPVFSAQTRNPQGGPGTPTPPPSSAVTPMDVGSPLPSKSASEMAATEAILAQKKQQFMPQCWVPALKQSPQPATAKYTIDISFNAEGKEVARGVSEDRSAVRSDVANCLRGIVTQVTIPPPGAPVRVIVPLTFP